MPREASSQSKEAGAFATSSTEYSKWNTPEGEFRAEQTPTTTLWRDLKGHPACSAGGAALAALSLCSRSQCSVTGCRSCLHPAGYAGPKPDLLYRLERGEEPWVCAPRGPATWDGPGSPTPGCDEDGRQPEEPCFTWWPSAGRRRALEESTQPPGHGGRREPWRLRCSRLLKKFGDPGGKAQAEAAGGRAPPVGSPERAQAGSRSGKEEAEDDRGARPGLGGGTGLPLPPVPRHSAADPCERLGPDRRETLQGSAQEALRAAGDRNLPPAGEDVDGAPLGDHCYCTRPEALLQHGAAFLPALREHDYCGDGESGASALRDHDYCQVWTLPWQGRARKAACPTCCARAELRRLCKRKRREGRDGGKGARARRRLRPCFRSLRLSRGYFCADCLFAPTLPASARPARAEDPTKDARGVFWPSAEWATVIPQPQEERDSRGGTPEAPCTPAASREPSAGEARGGAARPEVWVRYRARGRRPPRPWWDLARRELVAPSQASLCNACDGAMRTRNWGLCTVCLSSATCRARRGRPRLPRPAAEHLSPISRACPARGSPLAGLRRRLSERRTEGSGA
nr:uncharacterized protein LOC125180903 [Anser cygnoides]